MTLPIATSGAAAPTGRAFIMRGYLEDGQDTFPPWTIFDTTLPIWRLGEACSMRRLLPIKSLKTRTRQTYACALFTVVSAAGASLLGESDDGPFRGRRRRTQ